MNASHTYNIYVNSGQAVGVMLIVDLYMQMFKRLL